MFICFMMYSIILSVYEMIYIISSFINLFVLPTIVSLSDDVKDVFSVSVFECGEYIPLTAAALDAIAERMGQYECEYCGARFLHRSELQIHVKTHTGNYTLSSIHKTKQN